VQIYLRVKSKEKVLWGIGYDGYGIPKPEVLRRLGIGEACLLVEKIRRRLDL